MLDGVLDKSLRMSIDYFGLRKRLAFGFVLMFDFLVRMVSRFEI